MTSIDLSSQTVAWTRRLDGVFFEFLEIQGLDDIVVLHELGALRLSAGGTIRWSVTTDIVEESRIEGGRLILKVMDAGTFIVSLESGTVSR